MSLRALLWTAMIVFTAAATGYSEEYSKITVYYIERPPYLVTTSEGVRGLTGTPVEWAFQKAGVPFEWKQLPTSRQMKLIEDNTGCDCLVNFFKTPERENFAKFTVPIYQDRPHIALARADNDKLAPGAPVETVLSNPDIVLEVKKDWSYGAFLDGLIARHHTKTDETMGNNSQLLKKIHARRADFFFTTPEGEHYLFVTLSDHTTPPP